MNRCSKSKVIAIVMEQLFNSKIVAIVMEQLQHLKSDCYSNGTIAITKQCLL